MFVTKKACLRDLERVHNEILFENNFSISELKAELAAQKAQFENGKWEFAIPLFSKALVYKPELHSWFIFNNEASDLGFRMYDNLGWKFNTEEDISSSFKLVV